MPNAIGPAEEYALVPRSVKGRRSRVRRYRPVAPESVSEPALFDTRGRFSAHDFSSSFYWTPPLHSTRVFLRSLVQDKLHKVIYDFLKRGFMGGQRDKSGNKMGCDCGAFWAAPCGHPIFGPPVDFGCTTGSRHGCGCGCAVDETLSDVGGRFGGGRFLARGERPPWRP